MTGSWVGTESNNRGRFVKAIVTGAAGFIGSHLCEHLLDAGHEVHGVDAFIPYYEPAVKERNLILARSRPAFHFHRLDLRTDSIEALIADSQIIFHLAAMPGLTKSWTDFGLYESCNVLATQRVLEAVRQCGKPPRVVHVSTSSVYGTMAEGDESQPTIPISPYGVTKLAAENLCRAYSNAFGLHVVVLRYFSVYGPRQRPDMGYHKFIDALLHDRQITVYGDGNQVRGNTFVADCVAATVAAAEAKSGEIFNVGGGESASVWDILRRLESLAGRSARVKKEPARPGDQRSTLADTRKLTQTLDWQPQVSLNEGLQRQWDWQAQIS
jgi:nucleoside-diphosphate-sugar epimerase